jgi:serine/threonine protein kinase
MPTVQQDALKTGTDNCLPAGTRLADFEITGLIGEGGFGIVYLAFDHSLQRTVAIKEYMPGAFASRKTDRSVAVRSQRDQDTFATGLKSFINEARLLAQFDHPALIKVYRFWEENNTAYMAMRYYEGQTLKSVTRNSPSLITETWLRAMLKPVLEALEALYRVNILHRDISPDNIMIQDNGEAVLLDFGAARQIISGMSHALTVILKPGYAPIEQYADDSAMTQGPWTDIYSLSAVVYSAIVKKPPPTSVARIIKDPIELLQNGEYTGFSKEFLAAIDKGLAVKPEDRPQSIDEFRRLLRLELSVPTPLPADRTVAALLNRNIGKSGPSLGTQPDDDPSTAAPQAGRGAARRFHALWVAGALLVAAAVGGYLTFAHEEAVEQEGVPSPAMAHASAAPADAQSSEGTGKSEAASNIDATDRKPLASSSDAEPEKVAKTKKVDKATVVVQVNIRPWGTIYVDGTSKGVSPPLKKLVLTEGKHQIRIVNPNFPTRTIEIDVTKKKAGSIEYDFSRVRKK